MQQQLAVAAFVFVGALGMVAAGWTLRGWCDAVDAVLPPAPADVPDPMTYEDPIPY